MKKMLINLLPVIVILTSIAIVYAGNQYNWGTSTGANWVTPDDTTLVKNQVLVVGSTTPYPALINTTTMTAVSVGFVSLSSAAINTLTPNTTGQVVFCNTCIISPLCVSTGVAVGTVAGGSSWVGVALSTTGASNTCH